ncbi:hypothetical protein DFH09DRAFT_1380519 [Mycena vulgaris]|nr:hypothetical protein DFH09DRAFT_1380519 [Mycena vulgaris]
MDGGARCLSTTSLSGNSILAFLSTQSTQTRLEQGLQESGSYNGTGSTKRFALRQRMRSHAVCVFNFSPEGLNVWDFLPFNVGTIYRNNMILSAPRPPTDLYYPTSQLDAYSDPNSTMCDVMGWTEGRVPEAQGEHVIAAAQRRWMDTFAEAQAQDTRQWAQLVEEYLNAFLGAGLWNSRISTTKGWHESDSRVEFFGVTQPLNKRKEPDPGEKDMDEGNQSVFDLDAISAAMPITTLELYFGECGVRWRWGVDGAALKGRVAASLRGGIAVSTRHCLATPLRRRCPHPLLPIAVV